MILGLEIGVTFLGLVMLIRGKGRGKNDFEDWRFRVLGGFLVTLVPAAFFAVFAFSIGWAITHAGLPSDVLAEQIKWPAIGVEAGVVMLYVIIGTIWERSIKRPTQG